LDDLARDRGYIVGVLDERRLYGKWPYTTATRVALIDLALFTDPGGVMDVETMPLGDVEGRILESSGPHPGGWSEFAFDESEDADKRQG
jgi:hypothetical protein